MRRLIGIGYMLRGIAPIAAVIMVILLSGGCINSMERVFDERSRIIQGDIAAIEDNLDDMSDEINVINDVVGDVSRSIGNLRNLIPNIDANITIPTIPLDEISIPIPDVDIGFSSSGSIRYPSGISWETTRILGIPVPTGLSVTWSTWGGFQYPSSIDVTTTDFQLPAIEGFDFTIPGLNQLGNFLDWLVDAVFGDIIDVFDAFAAFSESVGDLRGSMDTFFTDMGDSVTAFGDVVLEYSTSLLILVIVLSTIFILSIALWILDSVRVGWLMFTGKPL